MEASFSASCQAAAIFKASSSPAMAPAFESASLPPATSSVLTLTAVLTMDATSAPVSVLKALADIAPL